MTTFLSIKRFVYTHFRLTSKEWVQNERKKNSNDDKTHNTSTALTFEFNQLILHEVM